MKRALVLMFLSAPSLLLNAQTAGNVVVNSSVPATSSSNQSGPTTCFDGNFWNGSGSAADTWCIADVLGTGTNPATTLTLTHSGSSGTPLFQINAPLFLGSNALTAGAVNNTILADAQAGADAGSKISAAIGLLPSTGGIIDARGFQGTQNLSSDILASVTKPVVLLLGTGTLNTSLSLTIPSNITIVCPNPNIGGFVDTGTVANFIHMTGANSSLHYCRIDTTAATNTNAIFVDPSASNSELDHIYVKGAASETDTGGQVTIINNGNVNIQSPARVHDSTFDTTAIGVSTNNANNVIRNNTFLNYREGVNLQAGTSNTDVSGNLFQSFAGSIVAPGLDAILVGGSSHISITHNVIEAAREYCGYIASGGNSDVVIGHNECSGFQNGGFQIHSSSTTILNKGIKFTGNDVDGTGSLATAPCVRLDQGLEIDITGNTLHDCNIGVDAGGLTTSLKINENNIFHNTAAAIRLRDGSGAFVDTEICNNHLNNNNTALGGFPALQIVPDNGGVSGGTNVNSNVFVCNNEANDYQAVATQPNGYAAVSPSNGSAINQVLFDGNRGSGNTSGLYALGAGYTASHLRHIGVGSPNGVVPGFINSIFMQLDAASPGTWIWRKANGDGTNTGWVDVTTDFAATSVTSLTLANLLDSSAAPTIAGNGCGGSAASIPNNNGTASFAVNVGSTPGSACTITLPTATNGWNCYATDITTNSTSVFLQKQTGGSQTTTVITNFNNTASASAFTGNDILRVQCSAF